MAHPEETESEPNHSDLDNKDHESDDFLNLNELQSSEDELLPNPKRRNLFDDFHKL